MDKTENQNIQFRKTEAPNSKSKVMKKIGMVQSFAMALASRGIRGKKINKATKQLRVLSCFGNMDQDGILPPCEHLGASEAKGGEGKNYCKACGCGDRAGTWLISEGEDYSKLDYPQLACPLYMPGFTNYMPSKFEESESPITRKYYIENIDYNEMQNISVSMVEPPKTPNGVPPEQQFSELPEPQS